MTRYPRISCAVPGCRRGSTKFPDGEIICGRCWRGVSPAAKGAYRRERRMDGGVSWRTWARCKDEATEAAAGLS